MCATGPAPSRALSGSQLLFYESSEASWSGSACAAAYLDGLPLRGAPQARSAGSFLLGGSICAEPVHVSVGRSGATLPVAFTWGSSPSSLRASSGATRDLLFPDPLCLDDASSARSLPGCPGTG